MRKMNSYNCIGINGETKLLSHYVWFQNTGYWPDWKNKREVIHHRNGNQKDDRFENLELLVSQKEHMSKEVHIKPDRKGEKAYWYGKKRSEETKRKISENHADVSGSNNPMFGKKRPDLAERNRLRSRNSNATKL
jgi:hypothetical protein